MAGSLSDMFSEFPPILVRLLAKDSSGAAVSTSDIAIRARMSERTVRYISSLLSWDDVSVQTALAFMRGCGFDLLRCRVERRLVRRATWAHVRHDPYLRKLLYKLINHAARTRNHPLAGIANGR